MTLLKTLVLPVPPTVKNVPLLAVLNAKKTFICHKEPAFLPVPMGSIKKMTKEDVSIVLPTVLLAQLLKPAQVVAQGIPLFKINALPNVPAENSFPDPLVLIVQLVVLLVPTPLRVAPLVALSKYWTQC